MSSFIDPFGYDYEDVPPETERQPPPPPTNLDFPVYNLPDVPDDALDPSLSELQSTIASLRKLKHVSMDKLKAFNLRLETDVAAESIVLRNGADISPPLPWDDHALDGTEDGEPVLMGNGDPYPAAGRYVYMMKQLRLDNDGAFREVRDLPPREGRKQVHVTLARRVWLRLERMSKWWDSSLDNYYERPATPPPSKGTYKGGGNRSTTQVGSGSSSDSKNGQKTVRMYTGRRTGTGRDMPEEVRESVVHALTELVAEDFGCWVRRPIFWSRLVAKTRLFRVRPTFYVGRLPQDQDRFRKLEGPVFIGLCRSETTFRDPGDAPGSGAGEAHDLFRELGAMLLAAQERAREGTAEVRPGEGKWWATKPRWGASRVILSWEEEERERLAIVRSMPEPSLFDDLPLPPSPRELTKLEKWEIVQPGPSLYDRYMRYMQIGKDKDCPFDDIYMISSINHHVAILHLRIHRRYLDILTRGESDFPPDTDTPDQPWYVLKLRRTRWYDLFEVPDRLEVLKGLWNVLHHMSRKI